MPVRVPNGRDGLHEARLKRKMPLGSIIVTDDHTVAGLMRRVGFYVLTCPRPGAYDMTCVRGLSVLTLLTGEDPLGIAMSIDAAKPKFHGCFWGQDVIDVLDVACDCARAELARKKAEV